MYTPDSLTLQKYAAILVNFALHHGRGVKSNDVVECVFPENAKPLARAIHRQILKSDAHPIMTMQPAGFEEDFYRYSQKQHHHFFPENYLRAKAGMITHTIYIFDPAQITLTESELSIKQLRRSILNPVEEWLDQKESQGDYSSTLALWPSEKTASLVNMDYEDYWKEVIKACQINTPQPLSAWKDTFKKIHEIKQYLNKLEIQELHVQGEDLDLHFSLPTDNQWLGGSGRNIPSYEVFTSPDYRTVTGWFRSNQIIVKNGFVIDNPELYFEAGRLTKFQTKSAQTALETMLEIPGMTHLGEVSLTDKQLSPITKRLGVTQFDENMGGKFGNFHLALGNSFKDSYLGKVRPKTDKEWLELGYNISTSHIDFVNTNDREVRVITAEGENRLLYQAGKFVL